MTVPLSQAEVAPSWSTDRTCKRDAWAKAGTHARHHTKTEAAHAPAPPDRLRTKKHPVLTTTRENATDYSCSESKITKWHADSILRCAQRLLRLRRRVGLLSPDGIPLTPPVYREITAINEHCYRGYFDYAHDNEGLSVLLNDKGQVITPPE